ncbi:hypothetical protein Ndes2526B_g08293 [Nannochloris sp. 'desiccata']|nr:hypothetical protein KSW81_001758 [Chlorella desiccata (nom. nud.)]KAH7616190.1 hypothetical protein NADE_001019 [Chlorella desiccata (nom. nud.)]
MPDAILTFEAEEAQKELQKLFKKRKNALEKDPNHVWDHFDVVKVATSSTTPQKFQINLKCKWCSKTVSASNPAQSMPMMRWIYRLNRTRLSLDKAEKMATVTFDEWLERRDWREDFSGNVDSLIESVIELD